MGAVGVGGDTTFTTYEDFRGFGGDGLVTSLSRGRAN